VSQEQLEEIEGLRLEVNLHAAPKDLPAPRVKDELAEAKAHSASRRLNHDIPGSS